MKNLNLNNYGVRNLTPQEAQRINGGAYWIPIFMLLGAMINDAQNNPDDFWGGFNATYAR